MTGTKWASFCLLQLAGQVLAVVYPPVSTDCTDSSSKSVSWEIHNLTADTNAKLYYGPGTAGKVSFSIKNTANGYAFNCLQGGNSGRTTNQWVQDGKVWYGCNVYCAGGQFAPHQDDPPLKTSFSFDVTTKSLSISQFWTCGGTGATATNYTGMGTTTIPNINCTQIPDGRPDQVSCSPVDVTVKATQVRTDLPPPSDIKQLPDNPDDTVGSGSNTSPFRGMAAPVPHILHNTPGCSKRSQNPSWTVSGLYHSEYGVRFSITNNALNYTQRCNFNEAVTSYDSRLQGKGYWNCTRFDPMHANYPANGVYTTILYGGQPNYFGVNESWYCDDEDPSNPTVYSAYAETKLLIKCNETRYCQPPGRYEDTPNLYVQNTCRADDFTLLPLQKQTSRVAPQQAVDDFKPRGYNCTTRSLAAGGSAPVWEVSALTYNHTWVPADAATNKSGGFIDEVQFGYANTATDSDWPMNARDRTCYAQRNLNDPPLDGSQTLTCQDFPVQDRSFRFDPATSTLVLTQVWSCDGMDQKHSNMFNAVGSVHVTLQCATVANSTKCRAGNKITVPMTNLTSTLNSEATGMYGYPDYS